MKTDMEDIGSDMADAIKWEIAEDLKEKPGGGRKSPTPLLIEFALIIVLLAACIFLFNGFISDGIGAAFSSFQSTKEKVASSIEQSKYQEGYDWAIKEYKVTNQISITIGELQEKANLEVLRVSEISYQIYQVDKKDKNVLAKISNLIPESVSANLPIKGEVTDLWTAITGSGVFTVNLKASEFVIDNQREHVLIRVPKPVMTQFSIGDVKILNENEIGKTSADEGYKLIRKQLEESNFEIKQSIAEKEEYEKMAKDSATRILEYLVKALNPQAENLEVEVEFIG